MGGGEHSGSAEAVADQNRGRGKGLTQVVGGGDQIVDVGGERGVGDPSSLPPSPVKSKRSTAIPCCF